MKRQLFKLLDEETAAAARRRTSCSTASCWYVAAALLCIVPIMLAIALAAGQPDRGRTPPAALFLLAPMILGQALLDLLLAATRWTHKMRHQVWARSIIEPYAGVAASIAAWAAGWQATGLILGYWAGTLGRLPLRRRRCAALPRPVPSRAASGSRRRASPMSCARPRCRRFSDFTNALAGRLDLYLVGLLLGESAGRHLRHGAAGAHADPPGPPELRQPADPDRLEAR